METHKAIATILKNTGDIHIAYANKSDILLGTGCGLDSEEIKNKEEVDWEECNERTIDADTEGGCKYFIVRCSTAATVTIWCVYYYTAVLILYSLIYCCAAVLLCCCRVVFSFTAVLLYCCDNHCVYCCAAVLLHYKTFTEHAIIEVSGYILMSVLRVGCVASSPHHKSREK